LPSDDSTHAVPSSDGASVAAIDAHPDTSHTTAAAAACDTRFMGFPFLPSLVRAHGKVDRPAPRSKGGILARMPATACPA
jgi:hypothetical protein